MSINQHSIWSEKYRPARVKDVILPKQTKQIFLNFVEQQNYPNLLLSGTQGSGKTTLARALANDFKSDLLYLNASEMLSQDFRTTLTQFVSAKSLTATEAPFKTVLLDEADGLSNNIAQMLRNFFDEYSGVARFILTANFPSKIIKPLRSRTTEISFTFHAQELKEFAIGVSKAIFSVLDAEQVPYDKTVVIEFVKKHVPDVRKILNELQRYVSYNGKIDQSILFHNESKLSELVELLRGKNFREVRQWVADNSSNPDQIFSELYASCSEMIAPKSIPELILILAEYQYRGAFVANAEINLAAAMVEILRKVEFK